MTILNEDVELKKAIVKILEENYNDLIPVNNNEKRVLSQTELYQILQDLYKINKFLESIRPIMTGEYAKQFGPDYSDKCKRVIRSVKLLEKL